MGRNLWDTISQRTRGGAMVLTFFIAGLAAFILSIVLSFEDTLSSLHGIRSIEQAFNLNIVSHDIVLWFMALAPQVGQMVFGALWTLDTEKKWPLVVLLFWFLFDFVADVQYRSAGQLFPSSGGVGLTTDVMVAASMTFVYFTIGAELFMVAGSALVLTLYPDARKQWAVLRRRIEDAGREADKVGRGGSGQQNRQRNQPPPLPDADESEAVSFLNMSLTAPQGRQARQQQGRRDR